MFADLLSRGGLSLDRLAGFCEVAEAGGVTKAARGDPVRQSLLSRQIKELEAFFGAELVRRQGRGIVVTEAGRDLHRLARAQLAGLADFRAACADLPVTLTLAAGESLLRWVVLPQLPSLRAQLPNTRWRLLNLPTATTVTRLREGSVDLAIVREGSVSPPLETHPLGALDYAYFVPQRMLAVDSDGQPNLKALINLPTAVLEGGGQFRQDLDRVAAKARARLNMQIELSSFPLVAQAVASGEFAGILPIPAARDLVGCGVRQFAPSGLRVLRRTLVLAWSPRLACVRPALARAVALARAGTGQLLRL